MEPEACALGSEVKDAITGYRGVVIAKTEWLNHCWRITVQSRDLDWYRYLRWKRLQLLHVEDDGLNGLPVFQLARAATPSR